MATIKTSKIILFYNERFYVNNIKSYPHHENLSIQKTSSK